jgi:hypothetical protein
MALTKKTLTESYKPAYSLPFEMPGDASKQWRFQYRRGAYTCTLIILHPKKRKNEVSKHNTFMTLLGQIRTRIRSSLYWKFGCTVSHSMKGREGATGREYLVRVFAGEGPNE